ncbi:MAG: FAD-dependent oxidoreductase [Candidatus Bipolaricaulia bacterium]
MGSDTLTAVFEEIHPPLDDDRAVLEASRCLECGRDGRPAPCAEACPTRIDVPKFIREIRLGHPTAAAETIFASNVLGGTCARVCPVDELCEGACVLLDEGRRAVEIGRLQRYATDQALASEAYAHPLTPQASTPLSVGVVGAGPAGLACAAELAQLGHDPTIYERHEMPGGLVPTAIAPYKQQIEPLPQETELIERLGVTIRWGVGVGDEVPLTELEHAHDALFLGAGLGGDVEPPMEGSHMDGVWRSLEFIEELKLGTPPEVGDDVVVLGGGNTAVDVAREAVRMGARNVTVLYRRTVNEMPAFGHEVEAARREGVHFQWLVAPERIVGDLRVEGIECVYTRLESSPEGGRPKPVKVEGTDFEVPADTVVLALGQRKRTDFFTQIKGLELTNDLVAVDENFRTSNPRVFAGGDCTNGGATVVEAIAHGKTAARAIDAQIEPTGAEGVDTDA